MQVTRAPADQVVLIVIDEARTQTLEIHASGIRLPGGFGFHHHPTQTHRAIKVHGRRLETIVEAGVHIIERTAHIEIGTGVGRLGDRANPAAIQRRHRHRTGSATFRRDHSIQFKGLRIIAEGHARSGEIFRRQGRLAGKACLQCLQRLRIENVGEQVENALGRKLQLVIRQDGQRNVAQIGATIFQRHGHGNRPTGRIDFSCSAVGRCRRNADGDCALLGLRRDARLFSMRNGNAAQQAHAAQQQSLPTQGHGPLSGRL